MLTPGLPSSELSSILYKQQNTVLNSFDLYSPSKFMTDSSKEIQILFLFNAKAEKISKFRLWDYLRNNNQTINIGQEGALVEGYPSEELDAVILTIRLFLQNNDLISTDNLEKKVYQNQNIPPNLKEEFYNIKQALESYLNSGSPYYEEDSGNRGFGNADNEEKIKRYSNKQLFDIMLYGDLAHLSKVNKYEKIFNFNILGDLNKFYFLNVLTHLKDFILQIKEVNVKVIEYLNPN